MNLRSVILAVTCLLAASIFAIVYLATKETQDAFFEGTPIRATVVTVKRGDPPGVKLSFIDQGKTVERWSEYADEGVTKLKPGAAVDALRHKRSRTRVTLKSALVASAPSPLLFAGTAAFVALGIYVLLLPSAQAKRRAARTSALDVITDSLRRTRTMTLVIGGGIAAFGGFMIWLGASGADKTASAGTNIGVAILGGFFALLGLALTGRAWGLRSIEGSWIMEMILRRPHEIAWIYEHVAMSVYAPETSATSTVHVWFADGKSYAIAVQREDARALLGELSRRAPHAAVGYGPEQERLYREDPSRYRPRGDWQSPG